VRCYAKNRKGVSYGDDMTFTTAEGLPTVTTSTITNITTTSAKGGGTVTDQGASNVTQRGICWSTSHNPTVSGSHANSGTNAGIYTVNMSGLTANTKYYVRAYATNAQGTAYGNEVSFTTLEGLPTVTTLNVTDITANTAKGHGKVTNQGASTVTQRGICWSTSPSPTINDSHGNSGTGTGEYEVRMTGLQPGTKYYVRAYATNAQGTAYGEQTSFTSGATLPTVVTGSVSGFTASGTVTNDGGAPVTERGICWSTSHNPTTSGTHGSSGTGLGSYTVNLNLIMPGTTYYLRAYAINSQGTAYGNEVTFTAK
jgi:FlaG/FlaF family flagellin (archaellin)